jgi:predicted RNA-binding protein with PIN domain
MKTILVVDGYNIIGAWPDLRILRDQDLAAARDRLIEMMAEFQGFSGHQVIIVFDAYFVQGTEKKYKNSKVDVIFTKENETADECIERLASKLIKINTRVYVATSDYTEQRTIFAQGAYRKSARELLQEMEFVEKEIEKKVMQTKDEQPGSKIPLTREVSEIFEKWRRGNL